MIDTIFMRQLLKYSGVFSLTDNLLAYFRLGSAQDVHYFYKRSHFNTLQSCTLNFSTNFQFIFTFKYCTTHSIH